MSAGAVAIFVGMLGCFIALGAILLITLERDDDEEYEQEIIEEELEQHFTDDLATNLMEDYEEDVR